MAGRRMCLAWMGSEIVLERCRAEVLPSVDGRQLHARMRVAPKPRDGTFFYEGKRLFAPRVGGVTNGLVTVRSHK